MRTARAFRLVLWVGALTLGGCGRSGRPGEPEGPALPSAPAGSDPNATPDAAPKPPTSEEPRAGQARPPTDRGVFDDLNEQAKVRCPSWTEGGPYLPVTFGRSATTWLAIDGVIVCSSEEEGTPVVTFPAESTKGQDRDGDGIPDAVDVLRGAKKAALNGAHYKSVYRQLPFPGGDVPRDEGVCTDVIVRSLRNAGYDLQELLAEDIIAHPKRYPQVQKPDRNIDHRRVRTLLPYFEAHFTALPTDPRDTAFPYLPGDVLFLDTLGDPAPEHVGIVSDTVGPSGLPLVVNNWTDGWTTREMDLLGHVPVTHRFRVARRLTGAPPEHAGAAGLLARRAVAVPADAHQLLLVTTPLWESSGGTLRRLTRASAEAPWQQVGAPLPVRIGAAGLGCGLGLHGPELCAGAPTKREGDKRAPAGVFSLGTAFGRAPRAPHAPGTWPYRPTGPRDRFVDDPKSPHYNTWQLEPAEGPPPWTSAERLSMYSLGLVVEHNTRAPVPGAGSAIFIHPWKGPAHPTVGCTALDEGELRELLRWLDPEKKPVLVQLAGEVLD